MVSLYVNWRFAYQVICPDWFSVPSTFVTVRASPSRRVPTPSRSTVRTSMKLYRGLPHYQVAPVSLVFCFAVSKGKVCIYWYTLSARYIVHARIATVRIELRKILVVTISGIGEYFEEFLSISLHSTCVYPLRRDS